MPDQQTISHFRECRQRLGDLRTRQDHVALTCAILRMEGAGGTVIYDRPFTGIVHDRPFYNYAAAGHGEIFSLAFYPVSANIQESQIPAMLGPVEAITRKILPLLRELPDLLREQLQLPVTDNWWRLLFHLGWHLPRPFLSPVRRRLLTTDGEHWGMSDETFVQLLGTAEKRDLLPGLIYSALQDGDDLCTCSETAISIIIDALEKYSQTGEPSEAAVVSLSADERRRFDQLRTEFLAGTQLPAHWECKLLKLANSFETPPATKWASFQIGGCSERFITLSRLNDMQEIFQIRGPATDWFCKLAERAGNVLPNCIPDSPILFDDPRGFRGPRPVVNRNGLARWVGFVFATIKRYKPEALSVRWETSMGPLGHGLATLKEDLPAASVLAIDLAKLTTVAEEDSIRKRETCSPFSVPSMEELGFQWADEVQLANKAPENYTICQLVEDFRQFGQTYCETAEQIPNEDPGFQKHSQIQVGASVSHARACLQVIPGFTELRKHAETVFGVDLSFITARRILETLVQKSNGSLSSIAAESLTLAEAIALLEASQELWEKNLPERIKREQLKAQAAAARELTGRLHVEDVDNFARVRDVTPAMVHRFLKNGYLNQAENAVQLALESILGVSFHKEDWGGEGNDLYTANMTVSGVRTPTAFMLKGRGLKNRTMEIKHCGKNGDQVQRLFQSPATLFVVQFVGNISEAVIRQALGEIARIKTEGKKAYFMIMDGQDTARLMHAYGKL